MTSAPQEPLTHTSHEPHRGNLVRPRSWLVHTSDAGRQSMDGPWKFRLSPQVPGTPGDGGVLGGEEPEEFSRPDYDDAGWDTLELPCHWVLDRRGDAHTPAGAPGKYGQPIYTNVQYPFPVDPPHVPDWNPTGDHRRRFEVAQGWLDSGRVLLRFDGVESFLQVWVNGTRIGEAYGSRLAHEFDVTEAVTAGENTVALRVVQWSAGSYLEDQDQWWLPGIFREVTLLHRPEDGIEDIWLNPDYDAGSGAGQLTPEVLAEDSAYPIRLRIPELEIDFTWEDASQVQPVPVGGDSGPKPQPWSPEEPRLYDVVVSASGETLTLRTGFRRVEIRGDRLLANGRPLVFSGVNRHETHPDRGRVFDEDHARADLALMKRHNVNAIRTSHYPPHPRLLDLADELGLWVVLECDLETHGFEAGGWVDNPSDDPRWREAYLDRIRRTVERDKNHPSIVLWSLGNESGTGQNLAAMAEWVHQRDPGRPVHYEGDYTGAYTDVYSRMYAEVVETESIAADDDFTPLLGCSVAESARQRSKPFIHCEYAHAMGNGPGGMDAYREMVDRYDRLHGGFIWEWRDHGIRTVDDAGREFFGYGGDFGETVHDGNFVMDGMVLSDGTPSPGLKEYAAVEQPLVMRPVDRSAAAEQLSEAISAARQPDASGRPRLAARSAGASTTQRAGVVSVRSRRFSADTSDLVLRWAVEQDGRTAFSGTAELVDAAGAPVPASGEAEIELFSPDALDGLSPAGETFLTVEAVLREETSWAPAEHVVAAAQWEVADAPTAAAKLNGSGAGGSALGQSGSAPRKESAEATPTTPAQDRRWPRNAPHAPVVLEGPDLRELAGAAVAGPEVELWRAPTDNDEGTSRPNYDRVDPRNFGTAQDHPVSSADRWRQAGLNRLTRRVLSVETTADSVTVRRRVSAAQSRAAVDVTERWSAAEGGHGPETRCEITMVPNTAWDDVWPRLGLHFRFSDEASEAVDGASWFGLGPHDSYPDTPHSVRVGRFDTDIEELTVDYARPQESGHRPGLRELVLRRGGRDWVEVIAEPDASGRRPGFTLSRYSAQELAAADHPHELPESQATHLYIDAAQHGLGSRACGPDVWPTAMLRPEARTLTLRFRKL